MVLINFSAKELTGKIVYYGPGLCGKTTNLQYIYRHLAPRIKGHFISLATDEDRTLFFDFLPIDLGKVRGMRTRFMLYTVPGQVFYNETRKVVMRGADAIIFVADSQIDRAEANLESFENMKENLVLNGINPETIPLIFQYNKRDLPRILSIEDLNKQLNLRKVPFFSSIATRGEGVMESFMSVGKMLMMDLKKNYRLKSKLMQTDREEDRPEVAVADKKVLSVKKPVGAEERAEIPLKVTQQPLAEGEGEEIIHEGEEPVAKEEVVLHSQRVSWFSIDGDTLKRDEESDSRPTPTPPVIQEIELQPPVVKPTPVEKKTVVAQTAVPQRPVAPPEREPARPEPHDTEPVPSRSELEKLQQENSELRKNQEELIRLMSELRKEMQNIKKKGE